MMTNKTGFLALLLAFYSVDVRAQEMVTKEAILANIAYQIPQMRDLDIVMGSITEGPVAGFHRGSFTVRGQSQGYEYVFSSEEKMLFLLVIPPVDISRTQEEIATLLQEEEALEWSEAEERHRILKKFAIGMPVRGPADASVTIFEFSDFQCPYCAGSAATMEELLAKYPEEVQLVYLHLPLESIHPWAKKAAIASVCAADQSDDAFWTLHDTYFRDQRLFTTENLLEKSRAILDGHGINMETWFACAGDETSAAYQGAAIEVDASVAVAKQYGLSGTPGFFMNGHFLNGAQPLSAFEEVMEMIRDAEAEKKQ